MLVYRLGNQLLPRTWTYKHPSHSMLALSVARTHTHKQVMEYLEETGFTNVWNKPIMVNRMHNA